MLWQKNVETDMLSSCPIFGQIEKASAHVFLYSEQTHIHQLENSFRHLPLSLDFAPRFVVVVGLRRGARFFDGQ